MLVKLKIYTIQEVFDMNLSRTTQAASQNKSKIAFYDDQITIRVVLGKGTLWQHRKAYLTK
jgi:collagenase-like PrtC family protease